ncbi:MAG: hypothetical protein K0S71_1096 [Clostridia bacterium]|jgi:g-D-glutamyl-meso-diaminopimelate peptidase|nr:hypothetical protein [Clostridia bacterium]
MKRKAGIILGIVVCICGNVFGGEKIFSAEELYTKDLHQNLNTNLEMIHNEYPDFTELKSIGASIKGKDIKALKIGTGEKSILINGAHHGREMMTAVLCTQQAKELADKYAEDEVIRRKLDTVSVWFVPLTNPDGVLKALTTYPSWKANAGGVDLNRNYPTKGAKRTVFRPSSKEYHGPQPFSEPETIAIRDFCYEQNFETAIAYHSAGEMVYWWFYQQGECLDKSRSIAKKISSATGYRLVPIAESKGGYGFTDWFIAEFNKPAFTLEIGKTCNGLPLGFWEYKNIWKKNRNIPMLIVEEMIKVNQIQLIEPVIDTNILLPEMTTSSSIEAEVLD